MWITKAKFNEAMEAVQRKIMGAMKVAELDLKQLEKRVVELEKKLEAKVRPQKVEKPIDAKIAAPPKPRGRINK